MSTLGALALVTQERDQALEELAYLRSEVKAGVSTAFDLPGETAKFTYFERRVLQALHEAGGRFMHRTNLISAVYAGTVRVEPREKIMDVWVCKIRAKLKYHRIETQWCVGWRLVKCD